MICSTMSGAHSQELTGCRGNRLDFLEIVSVDQHGADLLVGGNHNSILG